MSVTVKSAFLGLNSFNPYLYALDDHNPCHGCDKGGTEQLKSLTKVSKLGKAEMGFELRNVALASRILTSMENGLSFSR